VTQLGSRTKPHADDDDDLPNSFIKDRERSAYACAPTFWLAGIISTDPSSLLIRHTTTQTSESRTEHGSDSVKSRGDALCVLDAKCICRRRTNPATDHRRLQVISEARALKHASLMSYIEAHAACMQVSSSACMQQAIPHQAFRT
jgi:hypothetical protein